MKNSVISLTLTFLVGLPFLSYGGAKLDSRIIGKTITLSFQEAFSSNSKETAILNESKKLVLEDKWGYVLYQESIHSEQIFEKTTTSKIFLMENMLFQYMATLKSL